MSKLLDVLGLVTAPWLKLMDVAIWVTGKRSTALVRLGLFMGVACVGLEVWMSIQAGSRWWFTAAYGITFGVWLIRWSLLRVRRIDQALDAGSDVFPLPEQDVANLWFWAVGYTGFGLLFLPVLAEGILIPIRFLIIGAVATWLGNPKGGGKSAWARLKERIQQLALRPVSVGGR